MVFLEEIRRMKKMLIGTSLYTRERGKKKRLASGVIRPSAMKSRCVNWRLLKRLG
jgi:hypothetical protein